MRKLGWTAAALTLAFALAGCVGGDGGGHGPPPAPFVADILSDTRIDGDIDSAGTVTTGAGDVLAGVDPGPGPTAGREYRGFLSFPLTSVPANADVRFASLELFVVDLAPLLATPFTIDLVSFAPPLLPTDYDDAHLPPLLSRNVDIFPRDVGTTVAIDVTPLVQEAFFQGLLNGQFRLLLDVNENVGLMTIDDPLSTTATAPLLHIEYF
ncbi:MAG: hypothetical protein HZB55_22325 [Deltaproteobacteria bacterium]|nr:hypothetical protein [Deltaproteobacteria bacterium]